MCDLRGSAWRAAAALLLFGTPGMAQRASDYRARLDSLVRVWRPLVAAEAAEKAALQRELPRDSIQAGPVIVRADRADDALARDVATALAPRVERVFGRFGQRLSHFQFIIQRPAAGGGNVVRTGVVDPTGNVLLHSSDNAEARWLELSFARKAEEIITDEAGASLREFAGGAIPLEGPTRESWTHARAELLLTDAAVARDCVTGAVRRCSQMLAVDAVDDPVITNYDAPQRLRFIRDNAMKLRRTDASLYDRCVANQVQAACDSIVHTIPRESFALPAPPSVRLSFVRFALETGGDGAFDRFMTAASNRERIEAAARMPADSVIRRWRSTLMGVPRDATTLDMGTAVSALAWALVCGALALRSSRWR